VILAAKRMVSSGLRTDADSMGAFPVGKSHAGVKCDVADPLKKVSSVSPRVYA
jgi:hypothetical protein